MLRWEKYARPTVCGRAHIATKGPFMTSKNPNGVQINCVDSGAICTEIGERLRATLAGRPKQLPPYLVSLTERFDGVEGGDVAFKNSAEIDLR
jgi:hypothetical protein